MGAIDREEKKVEQPEVGEGVEERGGEEEGGREGSKEKRERGDQLGDSKQTKAAQDTYIKGGELQHSWQCRLRLSTCALTRPRTQVAHVPKEPWNHAIGWDTGTLGQDRMGGMRSGSVLAVSPVTQLCPSAWVGMVESEWRQSSGRLTASSRRQGCAGYP